MANYNVQKEGKVAKTIERQTSKIPSDIFLWTAIGAMAVSLGLFIGKNRHASMFVGQWAPSLLIMGLYNKLVKLEGHDKDDKGEAERSKSRKVASSNII